MVINCQVFYLFIYLNVINNITINNFIIIIIINYNNNTFLKSFMFIILLFL